MNLNEIRNISNPYVINSKVSQDDFIGRNKEIESLREILTGIKKNIKLKNVIITGQQTIGKSTLLNRFEQILNDHNFIILKLELLRDNPTPINNFEFFYEVINSFFIKYNSPDSTFFDPKQEEIWFSLTRGSYSHNSLYTEHKISFATKFASYKSNKQETLEYSDLESDFRNILTEIMTNAFSGLAIVIDEFQELAQNVPLMESLRRLSENLPQLIIIGAGTSQILENQCFGKILRASRLIQLNPLSRDERLKLIFKPLQNVTKLTQYEIEHFFHRESLQDVIERSGGNPFDIQILCQHMFDHFQNDPEAKTIALNKTVMENVINFYGGISSKSHQIKGALQTCSDFKLRIFAKIFRYEGFDLKKMIWCRLAFRELNKESEDATRMELMEDLRQVNDFGLFRFGVNMSLNQIEKLSIDSLANIQCKFVGDPIDRLYVLYLYKGLTREDLEHDSDKGFESCLALKLGNLISNSILNRKYSDMIKPDKLLMKLTENFDHSNISREEIRKDFKDLITNGMKEKKDDETKKNISFLSKKYDLGFPSNLARIFNFKGYLVLVTDVEIRSERRMVTNFIPILSAEDEALVNNCSELMEISEEIRKPLSEYHVSVNWCYLHFIPHKPLIAIFYIDISGLIGRMMQKVKDRNFPEAAKLAETIRRLDISIEKDYYRVSVEAINNLGFCLMNLNQLLEAEKQFKSISDRYLLAQANLAYIYFKKGRESWSEAETILKQIMRKKLGEDGMVAYINLAIEHPRINFQHSIAENLSIMQITILNLVLIYAQSGQKQEILNSFYKRTIFTGESDLIKKRVECWVSYYQNEKKDALLKAKKLLNSMDTTTYLAVNIKWDINIFESDTKNKQ